LSEELEPRTMADAAEYAKNQEPLRNVYETSDFAQGIKRGRFLAELRILEWIEENRSGVEFEPGEVIYRDHFNSQSLIAFIKGENK
jgi:hypothetical protein